jgi:hypothetical protein
VSGRTKVARRSGAHVWIRLTVFGGNIGELLLGVLLGAGFERGSRIHASGTVRVHMHYPVLGDCQGTGKFPVAGSPERLVDAAD